MNEKIMDAGILDRYGMPDEALADELLSAEEEKSNWKIIVLDDDPTGVQTVHDVMVYTGWDMESMRSGFAGREKLFFILTNSRSFTREETIRVHREIAQNAARAAAEAGACYMIVSRGDSTLRGHYPIENEILKEVMEQQNPWKVDAEILCPYFREGGRFTVDDVHYVKYGNELHPAGQTEFAKDATFGYTSSNLREYVQEKTNGAVSADTCISVPLTLLRSMDYDAVEALLCSASGCRRIIVNAVLDVDVKIFCTALYRAMAKGKHFTVRCAAAFVKALGNIKSIPLLEKSELLSKEGGTGGIIVVGSHTKKTTAQLDCLKQEKQIVFLELDSDLVLWPEKLEQEVMRVVRQEEELLSQGKTVCVSTKRTRLTLPDDTPEAALKRSVAISNALKDCVGKLATSPGFVVAKGGITSSDVGTKALRVKCAKVLGQIQPGIPVWQTGPESRFPGIPYVIFPGNVGEEDTLLKAVRVLL